MTQVIVIAQAGWVFIGTPVTPSSTAFYALDEAAVIRRWGTTAGLGEIALKGPLKGTIIDPAGHVEIAVGAVVAVIRVVDGVRIPTL